MKNFYQFLLEGYFDLEDKDYVMYHATPTKNIESILKNGLNPSEPSGSKFSEGLGWMADTVELAKTHAAARMKKKGIVDSISVLQIVMNPKHEKLFKSMTKGIYTARDTVPPEKISLYIDGLVV